MSFPCLVCPCLWWGVGGWLGWKGVICPRCCCAGSAAGLCSWTDVSRKILVCEATKVSCFSPSSLRSAWELPLKQSVSDSLISNHSPVPIGCSAPTALAGLLTAGGEALNTLVCMSKGGRTLVFCSHGCFQVVHWDLGILN